MGVDGQSKQDMAAQQLALYLRDADGAMVTVIAINDISADARALLAEGAAEHVPLVRLGRTDNAAAQLTSAGFSLVSTVVRGGSDVFRSELPARCVMVMGAEQTGVDSGLLAESGLRVEVPGTGQVESLNVSAATAVLLAEWRRQNGGG